MLEINIDAVSNREDWIQSCEVRDKDTNALVDLTGAGAVIVFAVRDKDTQTNQLLAQTSDNTITIPGTGIFTWAFTKEQMRGVPAPKEYEVGCTLELNGTTQQFFKGTVNVVDGIVP